MPDLTVKDKKGRSIKISYEGAVPDAGAIDRAFKQAYPEQPGRVGKPGMSFTPVSPSSLPSYQQPDITPDEMGQIRNLDVSAPSFSYPTRRKSDAQRVASTLFGPGVGDAVGNVDKYVEGLGTTAARQVIPTLGAVGAGAVGTAVGGPLVGIPLALAAGYGLNQVQDDLGKRYTPWLSKDTESITRRFAQSHPLEAIGAEFLPGFLTGHPSLSGSAGAWAKRAVGAASMAGIDLATQQVQHPGVVDWGRLGITALAGGAQSGGLTPLGAMIHGEPIGPGARPVASEPWQRFTPDGQPVDIQGQIPGTNRFDVQSEAGRFRPTINQLLEMSAAQPPNPNVGSIPEAMFARRTTAPEPVQPPIIANRRTRVVPSRGTIYLGNEDANLLRQTTGQDWTGAFLPAERVQQELTKLDALLAEGVAKGQNTDAIEHLRDLVRYGSDGGVKDLSLVDSARPVAEVTPDRREETGHKAIRGLVTDPVVQSALNHPAWETVTKALTDIGYDGTGAKGAKLHTEEALVKMAAGKANELGLTHDQARDLFGTLFEAGHGAHGDAFTLALQTGNKEFRGIANDTANRITEGIDAGRTGFSGQEPGTAIGGVPEGGTAGIGSDVRPAVSGLGRERFTAAANERINRLVTGINAFAGDGDRSRDAFASLPANLQRGLTKWATSRNLAQGAKAGDIHPDQLQQELVSRNLAPPGKSQDGRAFASWVRNDHAPPDHPDGFLWAESPYEAARIAHLNNDPFVSHVERAERFQVTGKDGKQFYYTPDFKITYADGRVVYEEIKPSTLTSTERVQAKANAAKVYTDKLSKDTGRPVEYRTVTEASMGPDVFKSAKDSDAIAPNLPEDQRKILNGRLQTAVGQARRQQASIGDSDARFARKPLFSTRTPQAGQSIELNPKKKGQGKITYTIKAVDPAGKTVDVETTDAAGKVLSRYAKVPFDTWQNQQKAAFKEKALGTVTEAINAPITLNSSFDLSAPFRQGLLLAPAAPKAWAKAWVPMLRNLSTVNHETFVKALETDPTAQEFQAAKGYLATQQDGALTGREEGFLSKFVSKLPGVKHTEQAYVSFLDALRVGAYKQFSEELKAQGLDPANNPKDFEDVARYVNIATGRGELPAFLKDAAPILNGVLFSPRYAASRVEFMNPLTYKQMTPAARKIAATAAVKFVGSLATALGMAKLGGADVSLDPDDPNFLKIKAGEYSYDIAAGQAQWIRYLWRTMAGFARNMTGEGNTMGQQPANVSARFWRGKLAPAASFVADAATGKTFTGEDFEPVKQGASRFLPLWAKDVFEAMTSGEGADAAIPQAVSFFGVGTSKAP